MNPVYGLTRSSVNLRTGPNLKSSVIEALDPQEDIQVLDGAQQQIQAPTVPPEMALVQTVTHHPPAKGYILKSAVVQPTESKPVFPSIELGNNIAIPSVPTSLPLSTFQAWLDSGAESPWLPAGYLDGIQKGEHPSVGELIRQTISDHRDQWDAWVDEVKSQRRESSCTLDEWLVILGGGREMWSFRTERIFAEASEHCAAPAWVSRDDVLHWTGHVRWNDKEPKYKLWYGVEFTKLDRQFSGWYKAALMNPFVIPTPDTELVNPENQNKVFDLSRPLLRIPADPEFAAARKAGRTAAQYIDIRGALGYGLVQHNLCGEMSVAALLGSDIIPFLKAWIAASKTAKQLLAQDRGTSTLDIQEMLRVGAKQYEFWRAEPSVAPLTPDFLRKGLAGGRMALAATGITSAGLIRSKSRIRHWIVVEDIFPVSNSAWVRLYNSFQDREEVYPLETVFNPSVSSSIGWWVEPTRPGLPSPAPSQQSLLRPTLPAATQLQPVGETVP